MGTRHLIAVICDGKYKVAQYGQWDGYPAGQGTKIVKFLLKADKEVFREKLRKCKFITTEEILARWEDCKNSDFVSLDVSRRFQKKYPALSRDAGSDVLEYVYQGVTEELQNSLSFAADSLFCKWAYVVNMDSEELEVYKGFNSNELDPNERFFHLTEAAKAEWRESSSSRYLPIKHFKTIKFKDLTPDTMKELEKEAYPDENE